MAEKIIAQREELLIEEALAAFTRATGLKATVTARDELLLPGRYTDATIAIRHGDRDLDFVAEAKQGTLRDVTLGAVKQQLTVFGERGVLIAPYLTAELAERCRQNLNLQFIDTVGNAYINRPGLYVFTKGQRPEKKGFADPPTPGPAAAPTALRMFYALLCQPQLLNAPYREVAAAAGIALGAVGWVFFDLEARGFTTGGKRKGGRRWLEPRRLIDEWVTNYAIKLRPKLFAQRFEAPGPGWWREALKKGEEAYWGGEVAAHQLTGQLKPGTYTLYIRPEERRRLLNALVPRYHLKAEPHGKLEIINTFWNIPPYPAHQNVVHPILAYADLVATMDPRNLEAASLIRTKYIDHAFHPD